MFALMKNKIIVLVFFCLTLIGSYLVYYAVDQYMIDLTEELIFVNTKGVKTMLLVLSVFLLLGTLLLKFLNRSSALKSFYYALVIMFIILTISMGTGALGIGVFMGIHTLIPYLAIAFLGIIFLINLYKYWQGLDVAGVLLQIICLAILIIVNSSLVGFWLHIT